MLGIRTRADGQTVWPLGSDCEVAGTDRVVTFRLDAAGALCETCAAAKAVFAQGSQLRQQGDRVLLCADGHWRDLGELIAESAPRWLLVRDHATRELRQMCVAALDGGGHRCTLRSRETTAPVSPPPLRLIGFGLTPSEHRVAELLLLPLEIDEIACRLGIAVGTLRIHRRRVYAKLGVESRFELAALALETVC